jgi:DDE superfamily endonuclease
LAHCIQKVPAKDGNSCSRPSPRCPLPGSPGIHKSAAGITGDNLNTHTMGAFYEAFAAERARKLVRRLEFRYTPKHGSWLNIAENELSALTRQCLHDRRFGETKQLAEETAAWSTSSNAKQRGVDWQFKINDARTKLKSLYPKVKD